ncbi:MAG TPA: sulfate reduction electron transfer complex DsrMKJOP subunit DsrJ [Anaeromyxobacter sp.]|nr:sulfate reduction electron transfer complex DsrMKJOP subunit DsrJ [Anaeromyxobacter sp.]
MHDTGKILVGLGVFGVLATGPIWYGLSRGGGAPPDLPKPAAAKQCVEPTAYMRSRHMELLDEWRDAVVRDAQRVYVASDGQRHEMSLTGSCLRCHEDQEKFCNKCHLYAGVETFCFDCHQKKRKLAATARREGGLP